MNLPGFYVESAVVPDGWAWMSNDLLELDFDYPLTECYETSPVLSGSAMVDNLPVAMDPLVVDVRDVPNYFEDYYNRIHLVPNEINVGNLVGEQVHTVEVWNAYTDQVQNLASITPTNVDGLVLDEPVVPPTDFARLESRLYTLTVLTTGQPTIDARWLFDFVPHDVELHVYGTRVVPWGFIPNGRQPLIERLAWLTDVLEAVDGTEQRRALRTWPRRGFEFLVTAQESARHRLEAMLFDWQARLFALPIFSDGAVITSALAVDDTLISVGTADFEYEAGGLAVVLDDQGQAEALEVLSVAADSITLKYGVTRTWPVGSKVYPARLARIADSQALGRFTGAVAEGLVQFDLQDNTELTATDSPTTYRGRAVLEDKPNWRGGLNAEFRRALSVFDNATGVRGFDDLRDASIPLIDYLWTCTDRSEIAALKAWLAARAGRLVELWVPTWQRDLTLMETITDVGATIKVDNHGYSDFLVDRVGRRDIVIVLRDGTRFYRRITAASVQDATIEQLTIDSALGQEVSPAEIDYISYLQLMRLESDALELAWYSTELMELRHHMRGLVDDI